MGDDYYAAIVMITESFKGLRELNPTNRLLEYVTAPDSEGFDLDFPKIVSDFCQDMDIDPNKNIPPYQATGVLSRYAFPIYRAYNDFKDVEDSGLEDVTFVNYENEQAHSHPADWRALLDAKEFGIENLIIGSYEKTDRFLQPTLEQEAGGQNIFEAFRQPALA